MLPIWDNKHLEELRRVFPDTTPGEGDDLRAIDRAIGAQRVVRWVEAQLTREDT